MTRGILLSLSSLFFFASRPDLELWRFDWGCELLEEAEEVPTGDGAAPGHGPRAPCPLRPTSHAPIELKRALQQRRHVAMEDWRGRT